ncbi:MAG: hypothetical protein Q8922_01795 [Bacteroidota bacterium]|nr:hypothetical protein [Bacteroidota bacterium]MDP4232040.1 hypothetical protein [Bacteroidota bacterium]MDP4241253.1 hypothetical protein [Bacteroidota bacterium]MDP4286645.1 hypothetical protein [Bacteroidota bacterium]
MKLPISILLLFAVVCGTSLQSRAQMKPLKLITYDSLATDSVNTNGIDNPSDVMGFNYHSYVVLATAGDWVFAKFYHGSDTAVTFQVGSTIEFYWQRSTGDSSRAWFILRHYAENWFNPDGPGDTVYITQPATNTLQMYSMPVLHAGFNTVEIHRDTASAAHPVFINAIVLKQHGTLDSGSHATGGVSEPLASGNSFVCFPNPFIASSGTTLHPTSSDARSTYIVMDLLGREVQRISADGDVRLRLDAPGTYFVRRRVGSEWVDAPLRISAQ